MFDLMSVSESIVELFDLIKVKEYRMIEYLVGRQNGKHFLEASHRYRILF